MQLSIKYLLLLSFKLTSLWLSWLDSSGTFYHLNQLNPVIYRQVNVKFNKTKRENLSLNTIELNFGYNKSKICVAKVLSW